MRRLVRFVVRLASLAAAPVVVASTVPLGACADRTATAFSSSPKSGAAEPPTFDAPAGALEEAGAPRRAEVKHGLCGPVDAECSPDADGSDPSDTCATSPDAGGPQATYQGCRVASIDGELVPRCDKADPKGAEGAACTKSSECAAGFDCVQGEAGPVCRRYCCSGSCGEQVSMNGGGTFCDVRKPANSDAHMIPVCMPVKACMLLREGECGEKETCAVVTESGTTSCVPRGDAKVGDSCDATHCDANLNCLGSPGDRRCYKLCRVDGHDCAPTETCTTGSVFEDTSFGVCRQD